MDEYAGAAKGKMGEVVGKAKGVKEETKGRVAEEMEKKG